MDYEGLICHPPMERSSFKLPVAVGCAYNQCKFCTFFKHLRYRLLPLEQIEDELRRVRDLGGNPKQVFLGDGNAFGMETSRLLLIVERIFHYFPNCRMINMDAAVTDIRGKTNNELRQLKRAGVKRLYLGIEGGLDDVLSFMQKDHDTEQAYREIQRVQDAELIFNAHIMTGIAGAGRGLENAEKLAEFFNHTQPERVINFSLSLSRNAPLYQDILAGRFIPASEVENLIEAHRLLELLETNLLLYDGFHDQLELRVWGGLPQDRPKMLQKLKNAIAVHTQRELMAACS
ncbi:radical SAM protein [Synergistales bacterium]|nr:radical SAM protein [Synergistales bacterium]